MTLNITPAIEKAYEAYLNEAVDHSINGTPILRRSTYPYNLPISTGILPFTAGYQTARLPLAVAHEANNVQREMLAEKDAEIAALRQDKARLEAVADEYQGWIMCHAGGGDYDDFLESTFAQAVQA